MERIMLCREKGEKVWLEVELSEIIEIDSYDDWEVDEVHEFEYKIVERERQ